jgi:MFS transporter, PAT family, beta-lactamase induction signal transducer AmpG
MASSVETEQGPDGAARGDAKAAAWTTSTYFAEGLPYAVVVNLSAQVFTAFGADLKSVGLTSLFHLPWNLKTFVGPFLDAYSTKRRWLIVLEALLALALLALSFATRLPDALLAASAMFLIVAVLSATHDIAIDGFYLEALEPKQQEKLVGLRAPAYRGAMLLAGGPIVVLADKTSWFVAMFTIAVIMIGLFFLHIVLLPRHERPKKPFILLVRQALSLRFLAVAVVLALLVQAGRAFFGSGVWAGFQAWFSQTAPQLAEKVAKRGAADWIGISLLVALVVILVLLPFIRRRIEGSKSDYARSFVSFLEQPFAARILLYVVLFRAGESFLMQMKVPFFQRALGLTQAEYGFVNGTLGMLVGIGAPVIGGLLIARFGFWRCIWPFLLAQNAINLLFAVLAIFADDVAAATTPFFAELMGVRSGVRVVSLLDLRLLLASSAILIETAGAGLGTAAFMVYLIRSCRPEHKAAHMALLTSLMSIAFTLAGVFSGFLAEALGYSLYFAFTFMVTLPGMAMTLIVPHIRERGAPPLLARESA